MRSLPCRAETMPGWVSVDSTVEGSTPRMTMEEEIMASLFAFREICSLLELTCFEKRDKRRSSDAGEWTQAMYLEKLALELVGALSRLFRIGVPRLPAGVNVWFVAE
jgi:hypothetical protein